MKTSVLINNHDYGRYVCEAVGSALDQTRPPDEVVVVDDGSTDDSLERLAADFGGEARVRVIAKARGGQLSAFNAGHAAAAGELVFFLDADDRYERDHVESTAAFFEAHPECDFLSRAYRCFGAEDKVVSEWDRDRDLGYSAVATMYLRNWLGSPTSTLCIRKSILDRFLPLPLEADWRSRADDCLIWGASIAGARKFYVNRPTTLYRVHDGNGWYGRTFDDDYKYLRKLRTEALIGHLCRQQGLDRGDALDALALEFASSRDGRSRSELRRYLRIVKLSGRPWKWRRKLRRKFREAMAGRPRPTD